MQKHDDSPGVQVWDVDTPDKELFTLMGHSTRVRAIAFSPDGRRIGTCAGVNANSGEIKLWDAETGKELLTLAGAARNAAFDASGTVLIGEMGSDSTGDLRVQRWDASPLPPQVEAE